MRFLVLLASEGHFDTWDDADDTLRERIIDDYIAFGDAVRERHADRRRRTPPTGGRGPCDPAQEGW